jgi:hypothetical protein
VGQVAVEHLGARGKGPPRSILRLALSHHLIATDDGSHCPLGSMNSASPLPLRYHQTKGNGVRQATFCQDTNKTSWYFPSTNDDGHGPPALRSASEHRVPCNASSCDCEIIAGSNLSKVCRFSFLFGTSVFFGRIWRGPRPYGNLFAKK